MRDMIIAAYAMWGVGALLGLTALAFAVRTIRHLAGARRAVGEVVAIQSDSADFPVVSFNADGDAVAGGRVVTFRSDVSGSSPVGAKVPVAYRPGAPENARIATFGYLWAVPVIIAIVALVFVGLGAAAWVYAPSATPIPGSAGNDD